MKFVGRGMGKALMGDTGIDPEATLLTSSAAAAWPQHRAWDKDQDFNS